MSRTPVRAQCRDSACIEPIILIVTTEKAVKGAHSRSATGLPESMRDKPSGFASDTFPLARNHPRSNTDTPKTDNSKKLSNNRPTNSLRRGPLGIPHLAQTRHTHQLISAQNLKTSKQTSWAYVSAKHNQEQSISNHLVSTIIRPSSQILSLGTTKDISRLRKLNLCRISNALNSRGRGS